uniref:Transmembrane protein 116 n=1 Tax=Amphilophus citrinellus TaxID=61819 RepID=A0A3Q0SD16_AMPCI
MFYIVLYSVIYLLLIYNHCVVFVCLQLQPLFLLSIADLLLAVCWLIGAILFSQDCSGRSMHCYNLHIVEQIFYMASFFYTLNYVWNLYKGIREKYYSCMDGYPVQGSFILMAPFTSGVTLPVTTVVTGSSSVLLHQQWRCGTWSTLTRCPQTPLGFCQSSVLVVKARCIYRRIVTSNGYLGSEQRASFSEMDRRMVLYPSIFVFCWGPGLVKNVQNHWRDCVLCLQALTSASQGFLNCLVYGWTRVHLRRAGRSVLSRDMDTQTPLLRAQRNRGYQTLSVQSELSIISYVQKVLKETPGVKTLSRYET